MIYNSSKGSEGSLRRLTPGEMQMLMDVFGNNINSSIIWVRKESALPFGLQFDNYGMTPLGDLYVRDTLYSDDYSLEQNHNKHFFVHEMTHSFQYQHGMAVWLRGLASCVAGYMYKLEAGKLFSEYNMEQQASIVADYYYLKNFGGSAFFSLTDRKYIGVIDANTIKLFQQTLIGSGVSL